MSAILDYFTTAKWALRESDLNRFWGLIDRHLDGAKIDIDAVAEIVAKRDAKHGVRAEGLYLHGSTGVIPISGVIAPHSSQVNGASQPRGTSIEQIREAFTEALARDDVDRIALDIDSPGGSVAGVIDMADQIKASSKPVVAFTGGLVASAAYWLASQASKVYATRGSELGSIGVYLPVMDDSRKSENEGRTMHVIRSGPHKGAGMRGTRLTEEQKKQLQTEVDGIADMFTSAVATGRGMSAEALDEIADGRTFFAEEAVSLGLADELLPRGTHLDEFLSGLHSEETALADGGEAHKRPSPSVNQTTGKDSAMPDSPKTEPTPDETRDQVAEAAAAAVKGERERFAFIRSKAVSGQEELVDKLINEGVGQHDALVALHDDLRERKSEQLKDLKGGSKPVGSLTEESDKLTSLTENNVDGKADAEEPKTAKEAWGRLSKDEQADEYNFQTFKENWEREQEEGEE